LKSFRKRFDNGLATCARAYLPMDAQINSPTGGGVTKTLHCRKGFHKPSSLQATLAELERQASEQSPAKEADP
jgi:hypothetical protein